jgi:hypothetical protein
VAGTPEEGEAAVAVDLAGLSEIEVESFSRRRRGSDVVAQEVACPFDQGLERSPSRLRSRVPAGPARPADRGSRRGPVGTELAGEAFGNLSRDEFARNRSRVPESLLATRVAIGFVHAR